MDKSQELSKDKNKKNIQAMPIHKESYVGQNVTNAKIGMIIQVLGDSTTVTFTYDDASTVALTLDAGQNLVNNDSLCETITSDKDILVS